MRRSRLYAVDGRPSWDRWTQWIATLLPAFKAPNDLLNTCPPDGQSSALATTCGYLRPDEPVSDTAHFLPQEAVFEPSSKQTHRDYPETSQGIAFPVSLLRGSQWEPRRMRQGTRARMETNVPSVYTLATAQLSSHVPETHAILRGGDIITTSTLR